MAATQVQALLSLSNPVFAGYAFYGAVLLLKMFSLALLTSFKRFSYLAFANQEDAKGAGAKDGVKTNDNVERVRRNHLNDLENIPSFLLIGLVYVLIQPNPTTALWHFRVFAGSRLLHTLIYQLAIPQPARAVTFIVGLVSCASMCLQVILKTL